MVNDETPQDEHSHLPTRSQAGIIGMWLLLAALSMLFIAGVMGYLIVRLTIPAQGQAEIAIPWMLWVSTAFVLISGALIEFACRAAARQRLETMRFMLLGALLTAIAFVISQWFGLTELLEQHKALREERVGVIGLAYFLILLHALHVVGGMIALGVSLWHALRERYDHEHHHPLRRLAMYWHFLDIVWIVLFVALLLA